ncbi:AAA family ATPase [Flammeovirga pacifica]|uniref:Rad50/SbcC-type AAA domain-containing protein n=1 Tax=Flammeovirga pacifica TaxID=915059 RepID=A0A1S1Z4W6_FLAPC|nr:AAA family ATPase [Flammeovirga pacifica]OHX68320.1 hypothetical protein NH26_19190 [Flammeovirga pacifica]
MRLKRLFIKNINSLKGEHTINFDEAPLKGVGLIAIVGKTGAGKSTILDAITLGLYNRISRTEKAFSKSIIQDTGALLTRGESEAVIEVDYEVSKHGVNTLFRSKWTLATIKQGPTKGEVKDYYMEVADLTNQLQFDIKKKEVPTKNEELIGLSYDQFVKSIMLSQGEFKRLLTSDENKRSELLEKITKKLDYRQISTAVFDKASEVKKAHDLLTQLIDSIALKSEEELEQIEQEYQLKKGQLVQLEKQRTLWEGGIINKQNCLNFTQKIKEHQEELQLVLSEKESLKIVRKKVEQYEEIVPLISIFREIETIKKNQETVVSRKGGLEENLKHCTTNIELEKKLNDDLKVKSDQLQASKEEEEKKWLEVEKLDLAIDLSEKDIKNKEQAVTEKQLAIDTLIKESKEIQIAIDQKTEEITISKEWLKGNQHLVELENDLPLIKNLLIEEEQDVNAYEKKVKESGEKISAELKKYSFSDQLITLKKWEGSARKSIETLIDGRVFKHLENNLFTKVFDTVKRLRALEEQESVLKSQGDDHQKRITALNKELIVFTNEVEEASKELNGYQLTFNEVEAHQKRVQWEASENITSIRKQLLEEEPCPVCGAVDHPYTKGQYQKDDELEKVEKEFEAISEKLEKQKESVVNSNNQLLKTKTLLEEKEHQHKASKVQLDELNKEVMKEVKWLKENEIDYTTETLKAFEEEHSRIEQLRSKEEGLRQVTDLLVKAEEVSKVKEQRSKLLNKYEGLYSDEIIINDLEKKKIAFQHHQNVVKEGPNWLKEYEKNSTKLSSNILDSKNVISNETTEFEKTKEELISTKKSREAIFEDKVISVERQKMEEKVQELVEQRKKVELKMTVLETDKKSFETQINGLDVDLKKLSSELIDINTDFKNGLEEKGIDEVTFKSLLIEESNHQRNKLKLKEVDEKETVLKSSISTYQQEKEIAEEKDQLKEESLEDLTEKLSDLKDQQEKELSELEALGGSIKNNEDKKKEVADKIKEREELGPEYKLWMTMNELIGSAQGDKFNKFAQSIVLRTLLLKANHHLENFTDRYLFAPPSVGDNKQLFIIDRYAGNTPRVVNSASGGESFLLSLSLSLGLADMASNNVKVESLFIDEGFGTLDEDTLDQAISALERLRDTGNKTISLISHLPQIKERISTKIVLQPAEVSGYSRIEVVG